MKNKNLVFIIGIFLVITLVSLSALIIANGTDTDPEEPPELPKEEEPTPQTYRIFREPNSTVVRRGGIVTITYTIQKPAGSSEYCAVAEPAPFDAIALKEGCTVKGGDETKKIDFLTKGSSYVIILKVDNDEGCIIEGEWRCENYPQRGVPQEQFKQIRISVIDKKEKEDKPLGDGCTGNGRECKPGCDEEKETEEEKLNEWCVTKDRGKPKCCRPRTCKDLNGIKVKTREEEKAKCLEPIVMLPALDLEAGEICCKPKEPKREAPKKPGTLGRLAVCIGKNWLWGTETSHINSAKSKLDEAEELLEKAGVNPSEVETLEMIIDRLTEFDQKKKISEVDRINKNLVKIRKELFVKAEELTKQKKISAAGNVTEAQEKLGEAQDSLEKIRAKNAMTVIENMMTLWSCAAATYKAAVLTLETENDDNEMGSCTPETPLKEGSSKCLSCNEDPYRVCTRERCEILGTCIAVPTVKGDEYSCIPGKCEETGLVGMKNAQIEWYVDGILEGTTGRIKTGANIRVNLENYNNLKPLPFNTKTLFINLTTDKLAQCRWILDTRNAEFSEMNDFEYNYYPMLPGGIPDWQEAKILLPGDITRDEGHRVFIKCKNTCGIEHPSNYDQNYVQFKLGKKPDQLPPEIVHIDPESSSVVRSDIKTLDISFWLDELGKCKFSDKEMNYTTDYDEMIFFDSSFMPIDSAIISGKCYPADCINLLNEKCTRCELKLDLTKKKGYEELDFSEMTPEMQEQIERAGLYNTTKFFRFMIRCEDISNNIMLEEDTLDYYFMTMQVYNITILKPEKNERTYDRRPEIEVTSEPRLTKCKYKFFEGLVRVAPTPKWDNDGMYFIDEIIDTIHKGRPNETLSSSKEGILYTLWVKCRDEWRIEADDYVTFTSLLDQESPIVIRMYNETTIGDYLIVETNENSTCVYGTSENIKCNYHFDDGTTMTGNNESIHAAYWQLESLYYIKCVDEWGNYPTRAGGIKGEPDENICTAIIDPYEVPPL